MSPFFTCTHSQCLQFSDHSCIRLVRLPSLDMEHTFTTEPPMRPESCCTRFFRPLPTPASSASSPLPPTHARKSPYLRAPQGVQFKLERQMARCSIEHPVLPSSRAAQQAGHLKGASLLLVVVFPCYVLSSQLTREPVTLRHERSPCRTGERTAGVRT